MNNKICFSPWVNWVNRNTLARRDGKDIGGIYLFARFEQGPLTNSADPLENSVIYIGQSSKGTFKSRWEAFGRAVLKVKGRGKRYVSLFGSDLSCLYVATLSVKEVVKAFLTIGSCSFLDVDASSAMVDATSGKFLDNNVDLLLKYMERRLILLYTLHHGYRPLLNTD